MPRTILCSNCKALLNLPDTIQAGKRMKCPKCENRFVVSEADASAESTYPGVADANSMSTREFAKNPPSQTNLPVQKRPPSQTDLPVQKKPPSQTDLPVHRGDEDLRQLFDLPLGTAESIEKAMASGTKPAISDAAALFQEEPARKKKPTGAEARAKARRCVNCGGVVPAGMSICVSCGVDQETGMRVGLDDDFAPPPPPPPTGPPLHIAITGLLCGIGAIVFLIVALIMSVKADPGIVQYCWLCLALVSAFGAYGTYQFYIGRSVKYLMLAMTLGVFVNIIALIALPIIQANFDVSDAWVTPVVRKDDPDSIDQADLEIKPIGDRLDQQRIGYGITFIAVYAIFSIYLMSPTVKRYFAKRAALQEISLG